MSMLIFINRQRGVDIEEAYYRESEFVLMEILKGLGEYLLGRKRMGRSLMRLLI